MRCGLVQLVKKPILKKWVLVKSCLSSLSGPPIGGKSCRHAAYMAHQIWKQFWRNILKTYRKLLHLRSEPGLDFSWKASIQTCVSIWIEFVLHMHSKRRHWLQIYSPMQGSPKSPDIHDLSEWYICIIWAGIQSSLEVIQTNKSIWNMFLY